jgi:hypothetical protein
MLRRRRQREACKNKGQAAVANETIEYDVKQEKDETMRCMEEEGKGIVRDGRPSEDKEYKVVKMQA